MDFSTDEGLRFAHRDRLLPLFELAFSKMDSKALQSTAAAGSAQSENLEQRRQDVAEDGVRYGRHR